MKPNNIKILNFINKYIISLIYILIMFWSFFFKGDSFSLEKIIEHKNDPRMYLALLWAIISLLLFRWWMRFPKQKK